MNTYLIGWLMFMAFYTGVYSNKKASTKLKLIILALSILWPIVLIYVILEKQILSFITWLMKGAK
jgi:hypothetical protein